MTPGARIQAAIELLTEIEAGRGAAADDVVGNYFRRHRFAGAKDRGAISQHIYAVLRHRASLDWWIERVGQGRVAPDARHRLFAALLLVEEWTPEEIDKACDGDRFRPAPLSPYEAQLVERLVKRTIDHPEMPAPVRYNFPDWLEPYLREVFDGGALGPEMDALNGNAPLDLRANVLKTDRDGARRALQQEGVRTEPTRLSPLGLRVRERIPLATLDTFRNGLVEVQDEGSQLAALLAGAQPGMRVVDFCAGAGGKTLALAAGMANRGHVVACDVSERRLERSAQRLRRAGISNVQRRVLSGERDKWVKRHAGTFDRVFVDAPCTGTGTWRRNPDAKWRLTPTDLEELTALQASILDSASRLAKAGGRVVYVTCSLLREEDEAQVDRFLATHPQFRLVPLRDAWRDALGEDAEPPSSVDGDMLRLTPARHGTDGFFAAVLERRANDAAAPPPSGEPD
ncbi:MAG TPA: RsmB/NOP family class I SAM-dependent RNA methyltransferase [Stellaceae bacterium]|jgi:16S rRNA (cytosine967-C5)-methyltransferase